MCTNLIPPTGGEYEYPRNQEGNANSCADIPYRCCSLYNNVNFPVSLVLVSSEYPQQHEEEVDEVEIESQRTEQCQFLCTLVHGVGLIEHVLDFLGVVCREAHEYHYTHVAHYHVEHRTAQEQVYYRGDDDADESDEHHPAQRRQVFLSGVAQERHHTEGAGGDEKHVGYRCQRVCQEYHRQSGAVYHRIQDEQQRGGGYRGGLWLR